MKPWAWIVLAVVAAGALLITFAREDPMNRSDPLELRSEEKALLLRLARDTLTAHLSGTALPEVDETQRTPALLVQAACFVTLNRHGALRGCILDSFEPHEPIYRNVMRNVVLAATGDPRFSPVRLEDVNSLDIEISVLGQPYALTYEGPEDLAATLRPGIDGVILTTTYGSSTYLPQVWEQLPEPETFLTELCRKHGAPGDCWRGDDLVRVDVYQVCHFSETDPQED